jgi:hypothetical protein
MRNATMKVGVRLYKAYLLAIVALARKAKPKNTSNIIMRSFMKGIEVYYLANSGQPAIRSLSGIWILPILRLSGRSRSGSYEGQPSPIHLKLISMTSLLCWQQPTVAH